MITDFISSDDAHHLERSAAHRKRIASSCLSGEIDRRIRTYHHQPLAYKVSAGIMTTVSPCLTNQGWWRLWIVILNMCARALLKVRIRFAFQRHSSQSVIFFFLKKHFVFFVVHLNRLVCLLCFLVMAWASSTFSSDGQCARKTFPFYLEKKNSTASLIYNNYTLKMKKIWAAPIEFGKMEVVGAAVLLKPRIYNHRCQLALVYGLVGHPHQCGWDMMDETALKVKES